MLKNIRLEIEEAFQKDESFVLKTQQQISKDFAAVDIHFPSSFNASPLKYDAVLHLVSEKTVQVMEEGERNFLQLLYRIDIPENTFIELCRDNDFALKMSTRIIYREAYKVYLRRKYSA